MVPAAINTAKISFHVQPDRSHQNAGSSMLVLPAIFAPGSITGGVSVRIVRSPPITASGPMATRPPSMVTLPVRRRVEEYGRAPEVGWPTDLPGDREVSRQRGQAPGDVGRRSEIDTGGDGLDGSDSGRVEANDGAAEIDASRRTGR